MKESWRGRGGCATESSAGRDERFGLFTRTQTTPAPLPPPPHRLRLIARLRKRDLHKPDKHNEILFFFFKVEAKKIKA